MVADVSCRLPEPTRGRVSFNVISREVCSSLPEIILLCY